MREREEVMESRENLESRLREKTQEKEREGI
jgi:hypothetical protein